MTPVKYLLPCLVLTTQLCYGQTIHNKDFNWTITIPQGFDSVSREQWAKMQNKGAKAVEDTYDKKFVNRAKTIFVFRSDQFNYFESNYQPFDTAKDGNYVEACRAVDNILYETFTTQMSGVKLDTTQTTEMIDGLEFQVFMLKAKYPNDMVLNAIMFSRLFGKKEFTVNIMYVDDKKGRQMLNAWTSSRFSKQ